MNNYYRVIIFILFLSCKDAKKHFEIESFIVSLCGVEVNDDSTVLRNNISKNNGKSDRSFLVFRFKMKFFETTDFLTHRSGTVEPGIDGSQDSIVKFSFYTPDFKDVPLVLERPHLDEAALYLIEEDEIYSSSFNNDFSSLQEFIDCYNKKDRACKGIRLQWPLVFEVSKKSLPDISQFKKIFVEIVFSSGRTIKNTIIIS